MRYRLSNPTIYRERRVQCVLEELYRPKANEMGLHVEPQATPFEVFDGNVLVTDVMISVAS